MRIARDGTWYYLDSPIGRSQMVRLFSRVLRYDDDGCHYLVTPVEKIRIKVECAPFLITQMQCSGSGDGQVIELETSTGEAFSCGAEHRLWVECDAGGDPVPLVHVRSRLNGLLHRNVYYRLIELGRPRRIDGEQVLAVRSGGEWFSLGRM
ncbi:MAG: DUF1285 domain-containing protein [Gammaproteobacteria bacterium AqS3]|nr:DUF1285 domain-containing protein [Gammaproteobacteria bacterium AqS3]